MSRQEARAKVQNQGKSIFTKLAASCGYRPNILVPCLFHGQWLPDALPRDVEDEVVAHNNTNSMLLPSHQHRLQNSVAFKLFIEYKLFTSIVLNVSTEKKCRK